MLRPVLLRPVLWHGKEQSFFKTLFSRTHPSRHVTQCDLSRQQSAQKQPEIVTSHDILEHLREALVASRDVIISSQICSSNHRGFFTLSDGCWLPIFLEFFDPKAERPFQTLSELTPVEGQRCPKSVFLFSLARSIPLSM